MCRQTVNLIRMQWKLRNIDEQSTDFSRGTEENCPRETDDQIKLRLQLLYIISGGGGGGGGGEFKQLLELQTLKTIPAMVVPVLTALGNTTPARLRASFLHAHKNEGKKC